ncbi:hypothetical protein E1286_43665 [Nonomuraea terrae]|uniref:Uncharacterized protein n=1 Tax=Nonomuraea terrae TaxID=2530383 RepID=A0A4R4XNI6_9ACTN|nr:hypothetical protein E1286_43665 [Nonomuraea terrae]
MGLRRRPGARPIKLSGSQDKVWFLALHVPEPWQWPVIVVMVAIGLAGFWAAYQVYRAEKSRQPVPEPGQS